MTKEDKRKWKKSEIYVQCGKVVEKELTYERFLEGINGIMEYFFNYKDMTIDIAFHYEQNRKIYELNINGYTDNAERYQFNSCEELLECRVIEGKTLSEIWPDLEN